MNFISVYLRLYGECFRKALKGISKNAWTLLLPGALFIVAGLAASVVGRLGLGIIGGLILGLFTAGLTSSYLSFLSGVVSDGKVSITDLKDSFLRLLWPVVGVGFVLWIASILLNLFARASTQGPAIATLFELAVVLFVYVNPTPEVIYRWGMTSGLATLGRSFSFIQDNWIEWYVPNLLLGAGLWFAWTRLPHAGVGGYILWVVLGALLHVGMVFRGHLFQALDGTSHRQRMFRYRTGS